MDGLDEQHCAVIVHCARHQGENVALHCSCVCVGSDNNDAEKTVAVPSLADVRTYQESTAKDGVME